MTETAAVQYQLPVRDESGENYTYHHHYEVLAVLDADAGPCVTCDRPTVRLKAKQHVLHNGSAYTMNHDMYAHADDGTGEHADPVHQPLRPKARCHKCSAYTITSTQEAYGDRTDCTTCGNSEWYSIGD
jgi:hypothetical protein